MAEEEKDKGDSSMLTMLYDVACNLKDFKAEEKKRITSIMEGGMNPFYAFLCFELHMNAVCLTMIHHSTPLGKRWMEQKSPTSVIVSKPIFRTYSMCYMQVEGCRLLSRGKETAF